VRFCATFSLQFPTGSRRAERDEDGQPAGSLRFRSGEAQKGQEGSARFAKRNETLRSASRKSLESLSAANQSFRGFVCFQGLKSHFVSPFCGIVCFQSLNPTLVSIFSIIVRFQWLIYPFLFHRLRA
jgi:hypothetical protein